MAGLAFETDDRLQEMCFGRWEGLTLAEVAQQDPQGEHRREVDKWWFAPPDGESYADLSTRIGDWLADQHSPAVVVCHGGVLRVLHHRFGGVAAAAAPHLPVPQDRITIFARGRVITI
jgi:probable phosphoglycerate mutase